MKTKFKYWVSNETRYLITGNPLLGTAAHFPGVLDSADELGPFFVVGPFGLLIGVVVVFGLGFKLLAAWVFKGSACYLSVF